MTTISIRCYGELNDYLPPACQQRRFNLVYSQPDTINALITALGIPATEVDLIIVNGESENFAYVVKPEDRIAIYPLFRAIDILPLKKLHLLN